MDKTNNAIKILNDTINILYTECKTQKMSSFLLADAQKIIKLTKLTCRILKKFS
jgi:hypothetical protein